MTRPQREQGLRGYERGARGGVPVGMVEREYTLARLATTATANASTRITM
jgi:hypothetical protein